MGSDLLTSEVQAVLAKIVRRKARWLSARNGFSTSDRDDIAQELTLAVIARLDRFDPQRGTIFAYLATIVERQAASLLRHHAAAKRDICRCGSLNVDVRADDGVRVELASTITEDAPALRLFQQFRHPQQKSERGIDLDAVIAGLSREERALCERLKSQNPTQIARDRGIPRSTLQSLVMRIRRRFKEAGLDEYC